MNNNNQRRKAFNVYRLLIFTFTTRKSKLFAKSESFTNRVVHLFQLVFNN